MPSGPRTVAWLRGALGNLLLPDQYRGRTFGYICCLLVIAIPPSALIGGWLADIVGALPLLVFVGFIMLGLALLAWSKPEIRSARITYDRVSGASPSLKRSFVRLDSPLSINTMLLDAPPSYTWYQWRGPPGR